ncbi:hypothetical protein SO802_020220 [Lithocarpus litseifolius]|uniref:Uncharacterized protein n=1 Tax=Lithocarpus litseifolius TaxID=425828 RepID=A0AAW2CE96_9ROSI
MPPYHSPEASPEKPPPDYSKAVVAVDKYTQFSLQQSTPEKLNLTTTTTATPRRKWRSRHRRWWCLTG